MLNNLSTHEIIFLAFNISLITASACTLGLIAFELTPVVQLQAALAIVL